MRKLFLTVLGLVLIALDQLIKFWVVAHIELGEIKPFLPPIFSLTYLRNYGAAFSMLQNQQGLFSLVTVIFLAGAGYYFYRKADSLWIELALLLVISGGIGNFIDRLRLGYVVDMVHLDFMDFAIFNVADAYLTVGVALMLLLTLFEKD